VFPVPAKPAPQSGGISSTYWLVSGGFDTMYTIWNPLADPQELLVVLNYRNGQTWRMRLSLEPYASAMLDIGELVRTQQPDPDGEPLPLDVAQGSLLLTSAANDTRALITAVIAGGIYSPRKATCGQSCETCVGMTQVTVNPTSFAIPKGGQSQGSFSYTWYTGTNYDVTASSSWSSSASQVLSVQTQGQTHPGLSQGMSPGSADIAILYEELVPANEGQICTEGSLPPCQVINPVTGQQGRAVTPTVTIQAQSGFISMAGNGLVVMGGPGGLASTAITAVGNPSGGSVTWTAGPHLQLSGLNSANASVSGTAASSSPGDTYVSVNYVVNGQSASASLRFTVLVPTALQTPVSGRAPGYYSL